MNATHAESVLLYDGLCGFCDGAMQFILARDRRRTMQFAALQGEYAGALFKDFPELHAVDSLILVRSSADNPTRLLLVRSDAVIAIAEYLGGPWRAVGWLLRVIPRRVRDWGYDAFAKRRFRLFGRRESCRLPSAEERARFLA